jgi:aminoglycoside phosphotransferase (APT) family kinase protein
MSLHENEYPIHDSLVTRLVSDQMPEWADLPLVRLETSGTVNVAYRLGDDKLIRLPRTDAYRGGPQREARWLPVFATSVPLETPAYLALGQPTGEYPCYWSVLRWIEGTNAHREVLDDLNAAATALSEFVLALRSVPTERAPEGGNYRGFGLAGVYDSFQCWLSQMPEDDVGRHRMSRIWEQCVSADEWSGPPTWFHSDLQPGNLLAWDGDLVAVIDWEGSTVGDPSSDLLAAWWLFDGDSRETFRSATGVGNAEWQRAKGWALLMAVAAIPYYTDTNPGFASQARSALNEILSDD